MQAVTVHPFREQLPASCPPSAVKQPNCQVLWRMLRSQTTSDSDFDSQRKRLPNHPYPNECDARSVSLVTSLAACRAIAKSPRSKFTHAVAVNFDPDAGVWHHDKETHVHLWPYKGKNLLSLTGQVVTL